MYGFFIEWNKIRKEREKIHTTERYHVKKWLEQREQMAIESEMNERVINQRNNEM